MRRFVFVCLLIALLGIVVPAAAQTEQEQVYTVQYGDTLYRISLRFGVSVTAIAQRNNIANINLIYAGAVVPGAGGECIGIAQTMEQEGRNKPKARTPLPGLYIVGCDAGGKGVATHQAVDSGFRVADLVLEDLGVAPRT